MHSSEGDEAAHPEQRLYAGLLDLTAKLGFVLLVIGFLAYAFGAIPAHVPVERLSQLWGLPLAHYLQETATPTGWGWIAHLPKGEFASLAGIGILAGCSVLCLAALVPVYLKRDDRAYAVLCCVEIAILLLAGSGVLTPGH